MTKEEKAEVIKEYLNNTFKQTEENTLAIMIGQKCFTEGLEKGLAEGRKEKWHDLRKNPNDLPKCTENEQVIFYVHEYYKDVEKYINHYCLGFYKKSFLNDDVKLFVERSKGYECEHSTEDVLQWCELPKFEG